MRTATILFETGVDVITRAESDVAVIGTPGASRRGYPTFDEAQVQADLYAWKNAPKELHKCCEKVAGIQAQISSITHRATAYTTRLMDAPDYPQGPPKVTVTVHPLNFIPYVQTPNEVIVLVGNCRVCIRIVSRTVRVTALSVLTAPTGPTAGSGRTQHQYRRPRFTRHSRCGNCYYDWWSDPAWLSSSVRPAPRGWRRRLGRAPG